MTNDEKERLKSVVIDWANGYLAEYSRHIYSTNPMIKYNKKSDVTLADVKILDSIIDRQPSEEASEWKDRIKEAVPTFEVEEWVDITKKMKMESPPGYARVTIPNYPDGSQDLDGHIAFVIPDGTTWKSNALEFKVEKGRLYRRVK